MNEEEQKQLREVVLKEINKKPTGNKTLHPLKMHQDSQKFKKLTSFIILFLVIVVFISSLAILSGIYYWKWENQFIIKMSQKLPLPVLLVDKKFIWLHDYYKDLTALEKFYQRQFPFNVIPEKDLKVQTLSKLVEKKLIEEAAKEFEITVSAAEIQQETSLIKQNTNGQNINDLTLEIFGWDFDEFTERVIKFEILTTKINDCIIKNQSFQEKNILKINEFKNQLDEGTDFENLGNYMGWFDENEIGENILENIKNLPVGQTTDIIETDLGYYILKLENKAKIDEEKNSYDLSQIFVKKYDLSDYLQDKVRQIKIYRFISI